MSWLDPAPVPALPNGGKDLTKTDYMRMIDEQASQAPTEPAIFDALGNAVAHPIETISEIQNVGYGKSVQMGADLSGQRISQGVTNFFNSPTTKKFLAFAAFAVVIGVVVYAYNKGKQ